MTFVNYLSIEEGQFSYKDAADQIECLVPEGATNFDLKLDPHSKNLEVPEACRDLISSLKKS